MQKSYAISIICIFLILYTMFGVKTYKSVTGATVTIVENEISIQYIPSENKLETIEVSAENL